MMKMSFAGRATIALILAMTTLSCTESKPQAVVDPNSYPAADEKEIGQLNWVLKLAAQELSDFADFDAQNQGNLTSYRYQIAFSVYFLAAEQYHKVPAWSEAIQPAMDRLIRKLLLKPVWEYWATTSKGVQTLEPNYDLPYQESHDPVGEKNIMYSGHVGHTINLYQMLYRDMKWDKPGSIVFKWSDDEQYIYDNKALEDVMYAQMTGNLYHSICCEPNAVFPECNQHPVLSFLLFDQVHGTKLSEASRLFFEFFKNNSMVDPITHEVSMLYLVKQGWTFSQANPKYGNKLDPGVEIAVKSGAATLESASADGWVGAFMHAWQPRYIEQQYPYWKKNRLTKTAGATTLKWESWEPMVQYGFFAAVAAELGDTDVRDKMLDYADTHYRPISQDGTYHYPFAVDLGCTNLTDKLLAMARAVPKDGLLNLHNVPFDERHFSEPEIGNVETDSVSLKRAIFDRTKQALVVSTVPGTLKSSTAGFEIRKLDRSVRYRLTVDGVKVSSFKGESSTNVEFDPSRPHDIVLYSD